MHTLDAVEFAVIADHTKVVVPQTIEVGDNPASHPFCVAVEDPDILQKSHVFEGMLFVKGWSPLSSSQQEKSRRILLEGFQGEAWRYEAQIEHALENLRINSVGIGKIHTSHHECNLPLEAILPQIEKANPRCIVISTLYNPWEVGLLIGSLRLVKITPPTK